jgi:hypothetical protein
MKTRVCASERVGHAADGHDEHLVAEQLFLASLVQAHVPAVVYEAGAATPAQAVP